MCSKFRDAASVDLASSSGREMLGSAKTRRCYCGRPNAPHDSPCFGRLGGLGFPTSAAGRDELSKTRSSQLQDRKELQDLQKAHLQAKGRA